MKRKILLIVLMVLALVSVVFCFTACENGKSAYQQYVDSYVEANGSADGVLTESEWLLSLKGQQGETGPKGENGPQGPQGETGAQGPQGADGLSAYDLYKAAYIKAIGSEEGILNEDEWLASLKGEAGVGISEVEISCGTVNISYTDGTSDKIENVYPEAGHNWDEGLITTNPTCITPGVKTYTCHDCGAVKREIIDADENNHVYGEYEYDETHHWETCNLCGHVSKHEHNFNGASKDSDVNELLECECGIHKTVGEFYAFKINFICSDGVSVLIYNSQDYTVDGTLSNVAYSRSKTGELLNDGEGQVNFEVVVALGYKLKSLTATPATGYKNFKGEEETNRENTYRITKITSELTVKVEAEIDALNLPVMVINTENSAPILDKENYVNCTVTVMNADYEFCFEEADAGIRGRGNSSWEEPKKPYKLKFGTKINLFGNGEAKKWVLLADCFDASMVRSYITYNVANSLLDDLKYTTSTQFVELFLNGEYLGLYLICEQNEIGETRVDINSDFIDFNGNAIVNTGYLLEMDSRAPDEGVEGINYFYVEGFPSPFVIQGPEIEDIIESGIDTKIYVDFIKQKIDDCYNAFISGNFDNIKNLVDVASFVDGYIIDELVNLSDLDWSSFYIYYDSSDNLIHRGPIWDYNGSIANAWNIEEAGGTDSEFLYATNISWYKYLLNYSEFKDEVKQKLIALNNENRFTNYLASCLTTLMSYKDSFERNYSKWQNDIEEYPYVGEMVQFNSWAEHFNFVYDWLGKSFNYLLSVYVESDN